MLLFDSIVVPWYGMHLHYFCSYSMLGLILKQIPSFLPASAVVQTDSSCLFSPVNTRESKKRKVIGFFVLQHPLGNLALNALPKGTKALSTIWGLNWHSATRPHPAPVATWARSTESCSFCVKLIELYCDSFHPLKLLARSLVSIINMQPGL